MSGESKPTSPGTPASKFPKIRSEDALPNALDKCVADTMIKTGSCVAVGGALSLLLFKRRMWPVTLALGIGLGMAASNCESNLNNSLRK